MKQRFYIIAVILALQTAVAQDTTNFWPHGLGDMWEYFYMDVASTETLRVNVIFDSTGQNGFSYVKTYERFISRPPHPWNPSLVYYVVDTTHQVFQSYRGWGDTVDTRKIYRLSAGLNEWWLVRQGLTAWVREIYQDTTFGVQTAVKKIVQYLGDTTGILMREDYLSDRFGLILQGGGDSGYWMRLRGALINGTLYGDTTIVSVKNTHVTQGPIAIRLSQNYPNPFNASTVIRYSLAVTSSVILTVHDVLGRKIMVLISKVQLPGEHTVSFGASNLPSGVYFYRLQTEKKTLTNKMLLLR